MQYLNIQTQTKTQDLFDVKKIRSYLMKENIYLVHDKRETKKDIHYIHLDNEYVIFTNNTLKYVFERLSQYDVRCYEKANSIQMFLYENAIDISELIDLTHRDFINTHDNLDYLMRCVQAEKSWIEKNFIRAARAIYIIDIMQIIELNYINSYLTAHAIHLFIARMKFKHMKINNKHAFFTECNINFNTNKEKQFNSFFEYAAIS